MLHLDNPKKIGCNEIEKHVGDKIETDFEIRGFVRVFSSRNVLVTLEILFAVFTFWLVTHSGSTFDFKNVFYHILGLTIVIPTVIAFSVSLIVHTALKDKKTQKTSVIPPTNITIAFEKLSFSNAIYFSCLPRFPQ